MCDPQFFQILYSWEKNTTLRKVDTHGGESSLVDKFPITPNNTVPPIPWNLEKIHGIIGEDLYFSYTSYGNKITLALNLRNHKIRTIDYYPISSFDIDVKKSTTYVCTFIYEFYSDWKYGILRSNGSAVFGSGNDTQYAYTQTLCDNIIAQEDTDYLYWTSPARDSGFDFSGNVIGTNITRGSKSCTMCSAPSSLFTIPIEVNEFILVGNLFYYAAVEGLFVSDMLGQNLTALYTRTAAHGLAEFNDRIYFTTTDNVFSIRLDGSHKEKKLVHDTQHCKCAEGFTGSACNTCDGQVQWYQSRPICVPTDEYGFPETCREDWQCGKPYTSCDISEQYWTNPGTCECNYPLVGDPPCTRCYNASQNVVWIGGSPVCQ